jgi:hypothetical protein
MKPLLRSSRSSPNSACKASVSVGYPYGVLPNLGLLSLVYTTRLYAIFAGISLIVFSVRIENAVPTS